MHKAATTAVAGLTVLLALAPMVADAQVSLGVNRLLVVSAAGTATENCQGLRDTLAAITDATSMNPYTLRLEPGEYDCGSTALVTKSHVDIEGLGEGVTRIFGNHDAGLVPDNLGVVDLVDQVEIRFLTVENIGAADANALYTAVSATTAGESRITNATLVSDDATGTSCGMFVSLPGGTDPESVVVSVRDSTIRGAFDGIFLQNGTGKVVARGSTIEGGTVEGAFGVHLVSGDIVVLAHSQLINGADSGGSLTCLYSYDGSLAELDSGCNPPP